MPSPFFSFRSAALVCGVLLLGASAAAAELPVITPRSPSATYALGETVAWTISLPAGSTASPGGYEYVLTQNDFSRLQKGTLDLARGPVTVEATLSEPAMLRLYVGPAIAQSHAGAAVAPTQLQPSLPAPSDFDAFWQAKLDQLAAVPVNAVITPGVSNRADVDYATIRLDNVGSAHVYGQLARPTREGRFPAMLILQWAGVYPLQKAWVTDRAAEGWLAFNVMPHDLPGDMPQSYYDALPIELKNYNTIGTEDRDKCYFLQMYLGDCRALDYLASRPDWDGQVLLVTGGSMGGQQSLCVAGLRPEITHLIVNEPAGCDTQGFLHQHATGYPYWDSNRPLQMETSRYFDPVNFAPRIRATSLVAMGFLDSVAPPTGIWIAYNQIPSLKEAVPLINAPHNNYATYAQMKPYYDRSYVWTDALVRGTYPQVSATPTAPVITWDAPLALRAGASLSAAQLNAHASVPGSFTYSPAAGTPLVAGSQTVTATFTPYDTVNFTPVTAQATLTVDAAAPTFTAAPQSAALPAGAEVTLTAAATPPAGGPAVSWEWRRNGVPVTGAAGTALTLPALAPGDSGLYSAVATSGAAIVSAPAVVGLTATTKTLGPASEVGPNILVASNGNTFDQVLLEGAAAAITADHTENQITRISFLDLDDDIVQVEFSGPGTLSVVLADPTGPALPARYNQAIRYMKGHAGIVITGADERSNVSVFSVGRATALNQALFKDDASYDGIADIAFIAIQTTNGGFGGVRTANAHYFAATGFTGLYAPGVAFSGPVFIGDVTAFDQAEPVLVTAAVGDVRITGGDLAQDNHRAVQVGDLRRLAFTAGTDSHGRPLEAQANRAVFARAGENVTSQIAPPPDP